MLRSMIKTKHAIAGEILFRRMYVLLRESDPLSSLQKQIKPWENPYCTSSKRRSENNFTVTSMK